MVTEKLDTSKMSYIGLGAHGMEMYSSWCKLQEKEFFACCKESCNGCENYRRVHLE